MSVKKAEGDLIAGLIPDEHLLGNIKKNKREFDLILMAGDLKRKKLSNKEIAKKMFPRDFNDNNDNAKPESKTKLTGEYCSAYEELVDKHGYRKLSNHTGKTSSWQRNVC